MALEETSITASCGSIDLAFTEVEEMNEQSQAIIHFLSTSTAALGPETHLVLEAISSKPALEISEFTPSSLVEENTGKANDLCQQPATSNIGRALSTGILEE